MFLRIAQRNCRPRRRLARTTIPTFFVLQLNSTHPSSQSDNPSPSARVPVFCGFFFPSSVLSYRLFPRSSQLPWQCSVPSSRPERARGLGVAARGSGLERGFPQGGRVGLEETRRYQLRCHTSAPAPRATNSRPPTEGATTAAASGAQEGQNTQLGWVGRVLGMLGWEGSVRASAVPPGDENAVFGP